MSTQQIMARIRAYAKFIANDNRIARESGVSPATVAKIKDESWVPSGTTMQRLESVIPDWFPG